MIFDERAISKRSQRRQGLIEERGEKRKKRERGERNGYLKRIPDREDAMTHVSLFSLRVAQFPISQIPSVSHILITPFPTLIKHQRRLVVSQNLLPATGILRGRESGVGS